MRHIIQTICLIFLFSQSTFAQREVLDRVIAVVDENIILQSELDQFAANLALRSNIQPQPGTTEFEQIRKATLDQLIVQKVLLVKAKEDSVEVDPTRVDKMLQENLDGMIKQIGSESKLEEYFGASIRKLRKNFRKDIEERLLVETLQQQKVMQIPVSRREVLEFYNTMKDSLPDMPERVNISHILISNIASSDARTNAYKKITEAKEKLAQGVDFAEVAKAYGDDPSAPKGGDLGFFRRDELVREYAEAAFVLEAGEVSDIVETQFGFHLIKLIEKRGEQIHTQHVLVRVQASESDEDRTIAFIDSLRNDILAGVISFEDAAKEYSEDQSSKGNDGNLGWYETETIQLPAWRDAAKELQVGQISKPIKTNFGFIIVKLNEREQSHELDIKEDYAQIEAIAVNFKREREFYKWVDEIKKDVYIKVNL
ncbi:MAG: peptidylprolyl isomerase [bacterium]